MQLEHPEPVVSVILPTYNEALTLPMIVPRILSSLQDAGICGEVIVVDDDSPDGTAAVASDLSRHSPVRLVHRRHERGLATAVLAGFALSRAEVCLVMDADGSHPVEVLPDMVNMVLADKTDLVVGSRHIPGGGTRNWSVFSQIKSRFAALLALGVTSMTDPTTGFMAIRRSLLDGLSLDPVGWKVVLELAVKAAPARIAEVPIVFSDRELGESKQSLFVFGQYLQHLIKLYAFRFPALSQLVRFCVVGLSGVFVDLATVIALREQFGFDLRICSVCGFAVAVTTNFLLNRLWTFRSSRPAPALSSYLTFVAASLLGLTVRMMVMQALAALAVFGGAYGYVLTSLVGIGFATVVNFLGAKYFAFDATRLNFTADKEEPASADLRQPSTRGLRVVTGVAVTVFALVGFTRSPRLPEERAELAVAHNIQVDHQFLIRPSPQLGDSTSDGETWIAEQLPRLTHPPLFPATLAAFEGGFGRPGVAILSAVCLLLSALALSQLFPTLGGLSGALSATLLVTSPGLLDIFARVQPAPLTTALGMLALWSFTAGCARRQTALACVGGSLFGLCFTSQPWLGAPFLLAATGFWIVHRAQRAEAATQGSRWHPVLVAAAAALGTGALFPLWIALVDPPALTPWLRLVYFGPFTGEGAVAQRFFGLPVDWPTDTRSTMYYAELLYRDHVHALLLLVMGLPALLRSMSRPAVVTSAAMVAAGSLGWVLLSVPVTKNPADAATLLPFLYGLTGLSLAALVSSDGKFRPADAALARLVATLSALLGLWLVVEQVLGGLPSSRPEAVDLVRHGLLLAATWGFARSRSRSSARPTAWIAAMGGVTLLFWTVAALQA